jgi:hypothetical protein
MSGGYYDDKGKITFDRADQLVERFIEQNDEMVERVTCKEVAKTCDIEQSHHNLIRLNEALDKRLEVARKSGSKATQYKIK